MRNGTRVVVKNKTFPDGMYGSAYTTDGSDMVVSTAVGAVFADPADLTEAPPVKTKSFTEKNMVSVTWSNGQSTFLEIMSEEDIDVPNALFDAAHEWNELLENSNLEFKEKHMIRKACDFTWTVIPNEICQKHGFIFADSAFDMNVWVMDADETEETVGGAD